MTKAERISGGSLVHRPSILANSNICAAAALPRAADLACSRITKRSDIMSIGLESGRRAAFCVTSAILASI